MKRSVKSVPMTWNDLVASQGGNAAGAVAYLEEDIARLPKISGIELTSAFAGCCDALARGVLLCGPATTRAFVRGFHPHLPRVMKALAAQKRRGAPIAHWVVDFALIAACMGTPCPPGFNRALLKPLVAARGEFSDAGKRSLALTALALGDTRTALTFLDEKPAKYATPVVRFEFNQFELIRYLAAALDQRRPADWIEPAWGEYVTLFPLHISAKAAQWPDPFKFARILANVRGDQGDIADDLRARIQLLAKQG